MPIEDADINNIAHLARINIDAEDLPHYRKDLNNILHLVDQINSVDTSGVEPMAHPLNMVQRLRDDVVTATNQRDAMQQIAPAVEAGLYLVPKVIETE